MAADDAPRFEPRDAGRDVVVVGASAGGVEALQTLLRDLPADLPAAVLVVLHLSAAGESVLARILDRVTPLYCAPAADGELLRHGRVYVAPPGTHLLVEPDRVRLSYGPRENGHRPAVDPLFRSAADVFDGRVCGIVLTGTRDDGTAGLAHVKRRGGYALVQAPEDAAYPGMPSSAIGAVVVDEVLPVADLGAALETAVRGSAAAGTSADAPAVALPDASLDGPPGLTELVCPECGGAITERHDNGIRSFTCHVGHRYGPHSFVAEQADQVEAALWSAVRSLEDRGKLMRRMATVAEEGGRPHSALQFVERAEQADAHVKILRETLEHSPVLERDWPPEDPT
ncbi:chemotaxis protein CheB [Conexibacter sp. SYSU D00693]|uniref:chemotaxis protein CheB n=1 Tax=Conexibacter sp. SYSU D00693 TaxID=2812560 RepID=UPI00196B824C|nr:chemotaxis protein CheB [Conexibacter sp. SYSU D00693]